MAIKLAREAIGVPSPPRSTPSRRAGRLEVNSESRAAAGTLLMTWLAARETMKGDAFMADPSVAWIKGMDDIFSEKTKKQKTLQAVRNRFFYI